MFLRLIQKYIEKDTSNNNPLERRLSKRYNLPLKVHYYDPIQKCNIQTYARNFSKFGLSFNMSNRIPEGTVLTLKIEDPWSDRPISAKAKIVRLVEFVTGNDAEGLVYEVGLKLLKQRLLD